MLYWVIALAVGFVLLLVSELSGFPSLRFVAASLLIVGGAGVGLSAAWRDAPAARLCKLGALFPKGVICTIAVVLAAPVLIALIGSLIGIADRGVGPGGSGAGVSVLIAGGAIGLAMLALAVWALAIGISAICGKPFGRSGADQG